MASEDLQAFLASMSAGGSRAALESYDLDALGRRHSRCESAYGKAFEMHQNPACLAVDHGGFAPPRCYHLTFTRSAAALPHHTR